MVMKGPDCEEHCSRGWVPGLLVQNAGTACLCKVLAQGIWTNYLFVVSFTPLQEKVVITIFLTSTQKIKSIKEEG